MFNMEFWHLPNLSIQIVHTLTPLKKMHSALLRVLSCPCFFVVVVVVVDCSGIQRNPQPIRAHKSLKPPK